MAKRASAAGHSAADVIISGLIDNADLYILKGEDGFLCSGMVKLLTNHFLAPEDVEFNLDVIDCKDNPPVSAITNALCEFPVMADKRVLVLLNAQSLNAAAAKTVAAALQSSLICHTTAAVIQTASVTKTNLAGLAAASAAYVSLTCECALSEYDRERWIAFQMRRLGLADSPEAVRSIAERAGSDTQYLQTQLEKLRQFVGERTEVTRQDVCTVIRKSIERRSWELTDAIRSRQTKRALELVQDLLSDNTGRRAADISTGPGGKPDTVPAGIRALGLLTYLNTYLRSLVQLRHLVSRHGSDLSTLAQLTGKKEFQLRKSLSELDSWSDASLRTAFRALCLADYHIKRGRDHLLAVHMVVYRLCLRK